MPVSLLSLARLARIAGLVDTPHRLPWAVDLPEPVILLLTLPGTNGEVGDPGTRLSSHPGTDPVIGGDGTRYSSLARTGLVIGDDTGVEKNRVRRLADEGA